MTTKIRIFYKDGYGTLIAFIDENQRARWYRYTPKRFSRILMQTLNWKSVSTNQAITFRKVLP